MKSGNEEYDKGYEAGRASLSSLLNELRNDLIRWVEERATPTATQYMDRIDAITAALRENP